MDDEDCEGGNGLSGVWGGVSVQHELGPTDDGEGEDESDVGDGVAGGGREGGRL